MVLQRSSEKISDKINPNDVNLRDVFFGYVTWVSKPVLKFLNVPI